VLSRSLAPYPFDFGRVFLAISLQPSVKLFDAPFLGLLRLIRSVFFFLIRH